MFVRLYRFLLRGRPADVSAEHAREMEQIAQWLADASPTRKWWRQSGLLLDLIILVRTVEVILIGKGVR